MTVIIKGIGNDEFAVVLFNLIKIYQFLILIFTV